MHSLFLREVSIDWDAVSDYTQHIAALQSFKNRLPFLQEKTAPANQRFWRRLLLLMVLIRRVVPKTTAFIQRIRIPPCTRGFI